MPGAPSEWCPEWYPYFEVADLLGLPPWEIVGFVYAPGEVPVCWISWAFEVMNARNRAKARTFASGGF